MGNKRHRRSDARKQLDMFLGRNGVRIVTRLATALPERVSLQAGAALGLLLFNTLKRYRDVTVRNLTQVFGDVWDEDRIQRTARDVFRHIGMNLVEFMRFPGTDRARLDDIVAVEGEGYLTAALAKGKGVIAVTSHYGNFELFGAAFVHRGYPLSVIARDADDEATNVRINTIRESMGYKVFPRSNAARQSIAALRRNEILGVLPDQNDLDGIFVPFFGRLAATPVGPAYMALHTGATLLPAFIHREPDNTHVVKIYPPIDYTSTGDRQADLRHLTALVNQAIEVAIREHPEQWFWLHNRWKKRPPEEETAPARPPSVASPEPAGPRS